MKRISHVAVIFCALGWPVFGGMVFDLDAPYDNVEARRAVESRSELQPFQNEYEDLIRVRIGPLSSSEMMRIFGPPLSKTGSLFAVETNQISLNGSSIHGPHPDDLVLPLFAPAMSMISGLHSANLSLNHDHIDLHAIGDVGYVEAYYETSGMHIQQAVLYLRADKAFVPLKSTNDFASRFSWDTNRFAVLKNWLGAHLPKLTDFGVVQIAEVSPLPEPKYKRGGPLPFKYPATVPTRVQSADMAFNIIGEEQPFPEADRTNHWVEIRLAAPLPEGVPTNAAPVFSALVTPGLPVAFAANGKVFSFTPKIVNVAAHPPGQNNALEPKRR